MPAALYADSNYPVRGDLVASHEQAWQHLAGPGTWFSGAERMAIAAEARRAWKCLLCRERKAALSPFAVAGDHDAGSDLPADFVDVIHRVVTDPGRLTRSWCRGVIEAGLGEPRYVELISVAVKTTALDVFPRALGVDLVAPPEPRSGEPSRELPAEARDDGAWLPLVPPGAAGGETALRLYGEREDVPNIGRSLSLVPGEVLGLQGLAEPHYMPLHHVRDPRYVQPDRALDRLQTELVAARVSAINECFY